MKRLATAVTVLAIVIPLHGAMAGAGDTSGTEVAFYEPQSGRWQVPGGTSFYFGAPGDTPLLCDWNGDGIATVGVYRESTGYLLLHDGLSTGAASYEFYYGIPGDRPLCGDWDGDGIDTIGIFRPSEQRFYLRNVNSQGFGHKDFQFGFPNGVPFAGDFNGDVIDTVGLRDPKNGFVAIARGHVPDKPVLEAYFGSSSDMLVVGDWDGDGTDRIAIYQPATDTLAVTNLFGSTKIAAVYDLGSVSGIPLAAEFNPTSGLHTTHAEYTGEPITEIVTPVTLPINEEPKEEEPPAEEFVGNVPSDALAFEELLVRQWNESWISDIDDDAVSMYYRYPGIDGLVNAYRATGNTVHIDRALAMSHAFLEQGVTNDTDGYKDDYTEWYSSWVNRNSHFHVEWRSADGVAAVVSAIYTDPTLASYRGQTTRLVEYLQEDVWRKWEESLGTTPYPHFIGRLGTIALALSNATGDEVYENFVINRGAELRNQIYDKGSEFWETDVSHLGDAVTFMVQAHAAGLVFTEADMQHLVGVAKLSWNGNRQAPRFRDWIDGQDAMSGIGRNQGGWIALSQFDDELHSIYATWAGSDDLHGNPFIRAQVFGALAMSATQ